MNIELVGPPEVIGAVQRTIDRAEKAEARVAELEAVESAAVEWWESHRPLGWSASRHAEYPLVNVTRGFDLARAVAKRIADSVRQVQEKKDGE